MRLSGDAALVKGGQGRQGAILATAPVAAGSPMRFVAQHGCFAMPPRDAACGGYSLVDATAPESSMSTDLDKLKTEVLKLPPEQRSHLFKSLVTSLDMQAEPVRAEALTRTLQGRQVAQVTTGPMHQLAVHFSDGTTLMLDGGAELSATVKHARAPAPARSAHEPTKRQFEYLAFIAKYIAHFGGAPAESDIQRHFLVSAPTVNQMMQMLERRGFITRQAGVPRSIRICIDLAAPGQAGARAASMTPQRVIE